MTDILGELGFADLSAVALLAVVVLMILRGLLVPRRFYDDIRVDRDIRLADKQHEVDVWREAHAIAAAQVTELLDHSRTANAVLRALPTIPDEGGGG